MRITGAKSTKRTNRPSGYTRGQWKMQSDRSGKAYLVQDIRTEWTGIKVGKDEFEPRHPQEYVRGVVDDYAVRDARPRADLLTALSASFDANELSDRDGAFLVDRDGNEIVVRGGGDSVIGTEYTNSGTTIAIYNADLGSSKYVSFLDLNLTLESVTLRQHLRLSHSADSVTWTEINDGLTRDILDNLAAGTLTRIAIGDTFRYIKLEIISPTSVSATYTVDAFTMYQ